MTFFDSHAHFSGQPDEAQAWVARAGQAGVRGMLAVGGSAEGNQAARAAAAAFPGQVWSAVGYDRDCALGTADDAQRFERLIADLDSGLGLGQPGTESLVAVGEIGLDYHYHVETAEAQKALLRLQLDWACARQLPVVLHSREAETDTLAELDRHARNWLGPVDGIGVVHCFTGSISMAQALVAMGYALGFSGIASFPSANAVRDVLAMVPESKLLIETDAPYLAPVPVRGKRNEPAHVAHVAAVVAAVRGMSLEAVAELTTRNACRLFGCRFQR